MFGYACRETEPLMPAPIYYAHRILQRWRRRGTPAGRPSLVPTPRAR